MNDKKTNQQSDLVVMPPKDLQPAQPESLSIEQVFKAVVEKQISPENIQVMKQLLAMDAERKFNVAFVALQSDLPQITATSVIPNRGKYEKFEDILHQVSPFLKKHGFSVSFGQELREQNRVVVTCLLSHVGGHSRPNSFAVRSGKADSDTQADCKASTTAKRNALCQSLNIIIRQDVLDEEHDAYIEGDPNSKISAEHADELERRAHETNSNIAAFLKFAGAEKFSEIPVNKYNELDAMLRRKESSGR
jgi:hypothetical protein